MPIKIDQEGKLYAAEVTPPHGNWRSPHPMRAGDLIEALRSIGCRRADIDDAIREVTALRSQRDWDKKIAPKLEAAFAGTYEVPAQPQRTEALLTYVLFLEESTVPLSEMVDLVDFIYRLVPTPDEVAWAFLQLRRRSWLVQGENRYGLTTEARYAIENIIGEGDHYNRIDRLTEWMLAHPPERR